MRVLTVGNRYPPDGQGGYETVWAGFVATLRVAGHDAEVLSGRELRWYWAGGAWTRPGRLAVRRMRAHNARVLDAALDGRDLVMWWSMGGMDLSLIDRAAAAGVPSLSVVHDGWPVYGSRVDPGPGFDPAGVDHWSFNSDFTRGRAGGGLDPARMSVERPGVDPARFPPAPAPVPWAGRLAVVGRVEPRKGAEHAVRALVSLPEARLTVTGPDENGHADELRALADAIGVGERVTLAGPSADPAAAYARADAVVFPVTWEEPFGLVPLEAMAVGRPVVATGTGGSAEYLRDGENALLVGPGDADAIAGAVRRLAAEPELRARLVDGGRRTAAAHTAAAFDQRLLALAERVAGGGRP